MLHGISNEHEISVTELRLWQVALSERQLKAMWKQPLSILFEQKRNLNIKINKSKTTVKDEQAAKPQEQVAAPSTDIK